MLPTDSTKRNAIKLDQRVGSLTLVKLTDYGIFHYSIFLISLFHHKEKFTLDFRRYKKVII